MNDNIIKYVKKPYLGRKKTYSIKNSTKKYSSDFIETIADFKNFYLELDDASNHILSGLVAAFGIKIVYNFVTWIWAKKYVPSEEEMDDKIKQLTGILDVQTRNPWNGKVTKTLNESDTICKNTWFINPLTRALNKLNEKYSDYYGKSYVDPIYTSEYVCDKEGKIDTRNPSFKQVAKLQLEASYGKKRKRSYKKQTYKKRSYKK